MKINDKGGSNNGRGWRPTFMGTKREENPRQGEERDSEGV
jgi:hypothetical protein